MFHLISSNARVWSFETVDFSAMIHVPLLHGDHTQQSSKITEKAIKQFENIHTNFMGYGKNEILNFNITSIVTLLIIFQKNANYVQ
jgi:hypothetical protein